MWLELLVSIGVIKLNRVELLLLSYSGCVLVLIRFLVLMLVSRVLMCVC